MKNLQGDVVKVYKASDNTLVASYTYDSWGNVLSAIGELATINPFRYRGYYYDNESWFYYLQSRYYDPAIGRFINADVFASTGQGFIGYNMFAYCNNNPTLYSDPSGYWFLLDDLFLASAAILVVVVIVVFLPPPPDIMEEVFVDSFEIPFTNPGPEFNDYSEDYNELQHTDIMEYKEHSKGARKSTENKHQEGKTRKLRDAHGEKGDARRENRSNKRSILDKRFYTKK